MRNAKTANSVLKNVFATALAAALACTMLPQAALADTSGFEGGGSL